MRTSPCRSRQSCLQKVGVNDGDGRSTRGAVHVSCPWARRGLDGSAVQSCPVSQIGESSPCLCDLRPAEHARDEFLIASRAGDFLAARTDDAAFAEIGEAILAPTIVRI